MEKLTVYGLPLNPMPALEQLRGASFCVSYGTREKLGAQLDQAIDLVGEEGILLIDNGAFSAWQAGVDTMSDAYVDSFAAWANDILDRCDQAWVVVPDVIDGTVEQNWQLACEFMSLCDYERSIAVWHLHEPISYLIHLCESYSYIAFGSSGEYQRPGTDKWHARIREAFAAIDAWVIESGEVRPRVHMMRAQAEAHKYPFDSSDSTNVAMNHNRQHRKSGEDITAFAKRVDDRIQASAGPEAEHQAKQPLLEHLDTQAWKLKRMAQELGLVAIEPAPNLDGLDIPEFLRRAA